MYIMTRFRKRRKTVRDANPLTIVAIGVFIVIPICLVLAEIFGK